MRTYALVFPKSTNEEMLLNYNYTPWRIFSFEPYMMKYTLLYIHFESKSCMFRFRSVLMFYKRLYALHALHATIILYPVVYVSLNALKQLLYSQDVWWFTLSLRNALTIDAMMKSVSMAKTHSIVHCYCTDNQISKKFHCSHDVAYRNENWMQD